jgi:hypothetical protein
MLSLEIDCSIIYGSIGDAFQTITVISRYYKSLVALNVFVCRSVLAWFRGASLKYFE